MREAIAVEESGWDGYLVEACLDDECRTFTSPREAEDWLSSEGCRRRGTQEIMLPHVTRLIHIYDCPGDP